MKNRIRERGAAHICQTEKGSLEKEGFLLYDKKRFLRAQMGKEGAYDLSGSGASGDALY